MTESPEATAVDPARTPGVDGATRNTRLYQVLAWVGIIAGVVFIVGAVAVAWQVVILGLWRKGARG